MATVFPPQAHHIPQMYHPNMNEIQLLQQQQHFMFQQQQPHTQAHPSTPPPPPRRPAAFSTPPRKEMCRYWKKDGRCPIKRCPHAASHTAANSPRYAKFMAEDANAVPLNEVDTNVHRRANALQIREPSRPGQKHEPPKPEVATHSPVQQARRPCALEIREPEAPTPPTPPCQPCTPPDAIVLNEEKDSPAKKDRTPSPPGSRLGRWMGGA